MSKELDEAKQQLQKVIGKSNLPKEQKKELGQKIKEAKTEDQVKEIMQGIELKPKEGLKDKISKAVKGPEKTDTTTNTIQDGVRKGVNDPETNSKKQQELAAKQAKERGETETKTSKPSPDNCYPLKRNKLGEPKAHYDKLPKTIQSPMSQISKVPEALRPKD